MNLTSGSSVTSAPDYWPTVPGEAFTGLAGDVAHVIEPHSESDPVAILAQTLCAFGNLIGRGPHVRVEADEHPGRLYLALTGDSARGRKGTAWGHVRRLFASIAPDFPGLIESGLSSGEGLIDRVRDPLEEDEVAPDKRLLVVETELASTLKVIERHGNTLSPVLRSAWDGITLGTLTRNSRLRATGTHVSIIGHITVEELRQRLDATEAANGFGNRFLWLCVRRSKLLPEGGNVPEQDLNELRRRLHSAYRHALKAGALQRDNEAREVWAEVYPTLSDGHGGLIGALTTRSEAQVTRLALVYALLEQTDAIAPRHLKAALALWRYAVESVEHVFGDSTGNPDADAILRALKATSEGLTRTEISDLFARSRTANKIERALVVLLEQRRAHFVKEPTGGRPVERWHYGTPKQPNEPKKAPSNGSRPWPEEPAPSATTSVPRTGRGGTHAR